MRSKSEHEFKCFPAKTTWTHVLILISEKIDYKKNLAIFEFELCFFFSIFLALGYNKQRHDASIQADLNKLYDTRPTSGKKNFSFMYMIRYFDSKYPYFQTQFYFPGSFISDVFSRNNVQRAATSQKVSEATTSEDENNSAAPYFDLNHSGNVTAVLGKTALLNCRVKNIGNKTVRRDTCVEINYLPIF